MLTSMLASCVLFHDKHTQSCELADPDKCIKRLLTPAQTHCNNGQLVPFKDYLEFWNALQAPVPTPKHYTQAIKLLFSAVAKQELTPEQTTWADNQAVAIKHASMMAQALTAKLDNSPKSIERCLDAARKLVQFRTTFPAQTRNESIQCAERRLDDPFGIEYAKLFEDTKPLQPVQFAKAQPDQKKTQNNDSVPTDITFTATITLPDANSRKEIFLNFKGLPKDSTVLFDNIQQIPHPKNAKSSFRIQLPYASKTQKTATVVLQIKTIQPNFILLTPWLSSRDLDRRDRGR